MANIVGANIYTDGLKRNEYPVSLTGTFNLSAWYNPLDNVSAEATLVYDDGTESPKSNIVEFQLTAITFDPLYQKVLDDATALSITTPTTPQNLINDAIVRNLRSDNLLLDNDLFYYFQQDDAALYDFCTLNWMNPLQYRLLNGGANPVEFVPNFGFKVTGGNNQYFNTQFTPSNAVHAIPNPGSSMTFKMFEISQTSGNVRIAGVFGPGQFYVGKSNSNNLLPRLFNTNANFQTFSLDKMVKQIVVTNTLTEVISYINGNEEGRVAVNADAAPTGHFHLFSLNNIGTPIPSELGFGLQYYMLGAARTGLQQEKLFSIFGGGKIYPKTPDGVLKFDLSNTVLDGIYFPQVVPSSKFPTLNTTKNYIVIYSTDHSAAGENDGAVAWGEADNEALDGFIERGIIVSGWQSETGWLQLVSNDPDEETVHLHYHPMTTHPDSGGFQQTRLLTRTGGDLHDSAGWTDRGKVLEIINPPETENHTGYSATFLKGDGSLVSIHHTKGYVGSTVDTINRFGKSTSTNGRTWVRETSYIDNTSFMPAGRLFHMSPAYFFERNAQQYALGLSMSYNYSQSSRNIAICKSAGYYPNELVAEIASANGGNAAKIAGYYINPSLPNVLNIYYTKNSTGIYHTTWDLTNLD